MYRHEKEKKSMKYEDDIHVGGKNSKPRHENFKTSIKGKFKSGYKIRSITIIF